MYSLTAPFSLYVGNTGNLQELMEVSVYVYVVLRKKPRQDLRLVTAGTKATAQTLID